MSWRLLTATASRLVIRLNTAGLRILDAHMQPVPPGVAGVLSYRYPAGAGLSGASDLTANNRLSPIAFAPGRTDVPYRKMWRAGWIAARWSTGRSDDQLKIRGQRIELGEIDRVMQTLPDVRR